MNSLAHQSADKNKHEHLNALLKQNMKELDDFDFDLMKNLKDKIEASDAIP